MPVATRRLALVAALASVLVMVGPFPAPWGLVVANAVLVSLAAADALRAPRPDRVAVERDAPAIVALDGRAHIVWRVSNPTGRRLRVSVADQLAPSLRAGLRRFSVEVPPLGRKTVTTGINPSRRGRFTPTEMDVRVFGPLGLAGRQARRAVPGIVRVYPPFRSRREAELRIERARLLDVGLRSARGRGGGTEFDQLREFADGDEFRRIDWPATARTGKTIVRTYRAERNQSIVLLLDTGRVMAGQVDGVPRLDHAMDAVMMLVTVATRLGDRAGLVAFDQAVRAAVAPGRNLAQVTEAMYRLQPRLVESDFRGALVSATTRFRRRHLLIVLTDLMEPVLGPGLLPALPQMSRDHVVMVAGVRDPAVERWAHGRPADPAGAYRQAAAVAALDERRRLAARMARMGAVVVDEVPGRLAPALTDAYLEIKATGRL